jgi:hypothetical protein
MEEQIVCLKPMYGEIVSLYTNEGMTVKLFDGSITFMQIEDLIANGFSIVLKSDESCKYMFTVLVENDVLKCLDISPIHENAYNLMKEMGIID